MREVVDYIVKGNGVIGMELGSTRIKTVLIGEDFSVLAAGSYEWENELKDGIWTYSLESIWAGVQQSYLEMAEAVKDRYRVILHKVKGIGFSAMMHGSLVFDDNENLLTPLRTWRNTITKQASEELTRLFGFNIPQRWSIAHLYQAMLNNENHVQNISYLTTLAGYIHWQLTGEKVLGVGDASGMFPIDADGVSYDKTMLKKFDTLAQKKNLKWKLKEILPNILSAGQNAGTLTDRGAMLLDPSGNLQSGAQLCPPEGDAGTGMVATNSVETRTGNVSAGTSIFAMFVLERPLSKVYPEIDLVTTPEGKPVAMVHCNTFTSDINAWAGLFGEVLKLFGAGADKNTLMTALFKQSLFGDKDCGGLMNYNNFAGEPIVGLTEGRPLFVRTPNAKLNLANFMKTQIYSALATLKIGMDILKEENIMIDSVCGHGGFFKTKEVGQRAMAAAVNAPVSVMENAGEGGAWGISVLAAYTLEKDKKNLADYLGKKVFIHSKKYVINPKKEDLDDFNDFVIRYKKALDVEKAAIKEI